MLSISSGPVQFEKRDLASCTAAHHVVSRLPREDGPGLGLGEREVFEIGLVQMPGQSPQIDPPPQGACALRRMRTQPAASLSPLEAFGQNEWLGKRETHILEHKFQRHKYAPFPVY